MSLTLQLFLLHQSQGGASGASLVGFISQGHPSESPYQHSKPAFIPATFFGDTHWTCVSTQHPPSLASLLPSYPAHTLLRSFLARFKSANPAPSGQASPCLQGPATASAAMPTFRHLSSATPGATGRPGQDIERGAHLKCETCPVDAPRTVSSQLQQPCHTPPLLFCNTWSSRQTKGKRMPCTATVCIKGRVAASLSAGPSPQTF